MSEGQFSGAAIELFADAVEERDGLVADLAEMRGNYERACQTIAAMHAAAMGEVCGPHRGVVEDVADLRTELVAAWQRIAELEEGVAWAHRVHQYMVHNIGIIARFGDRLLSEAPKSVRP